MNTTLRKIKDDNGVRGVDAARQYLTGSHNIDFRLKGTSAFADGFNRIMTNNYMHIVTLSDFG